MWNAANQHLKKLAPYQPGKPVEDVARELGFDPASIIKLASNENPLGPSPMAVEAMRKQLGGSHLYPDAGGYLLKEKLATALGVDRSWIVLGAGSNEIIEFLFHAFTMPGKGGVVASQNAFLVYKLCAALFDAPFYEAPEKGFAHDPSAFLHAIREDTRLVLIANPNNPTGTRMANEPLRSLIEEIPSHIPIVLDEAYYEYLDDQPPSIEWLREKPNLILLRTFSKIYGLAGLRVGYGIMHPEMADVLERCRQPFNTTALGQVAAIAAMDDQEHIRKSREMNREGLARLAQECKQHGATFIPSEGNFITLFVGDSEAAFHFFQNNRVIIRPLRGYRMPGWVRISIGTKAEMDRLIEQAQAWWKQYPPQEPPCA